MKKIGIFGGSFNPPGIHHRKIVEKLLGENVVDVVIVIPCGTRKDKSFPDNEDRKRMLEISFRDISRCYVNTFNLDLDTFTSNYKYEQIFKFLGEIWHIVGSDQIIGGGNRESLIQTRWEKGEWAFNNLKFIIVERPGFIIEKGDLPANNKILDFLIDGSSTNIRKSIIDGTCSTILDEEVYEYIIKHNLYNSNQNL